MRAEPLAPAAVLAAIRAPFEAEGADLVDAPILQPLSLFLELAGEAMRARLFVVQSQDGTETCLRPDFTVPVVRQHLESGGSSGRYVYEGKAFRAAGEGADGPEEFRQIGLERFDPADASTVEADAEIAALAWRAAVAGGRSDLTLWLGDVALFATFLDGLELPETLAARLKRVAARPRLLAAELARAGAPGAEAPQARLADLLSGLSEADAAALLEEVWSLAGVEPVGGRGPAEIAQRLIRRADAARAPALTLAQADAIRRFLSVEQAPAGAIAAVSALGGPSVEAALADWSVRLERLKAAGVPESSMRLSTALGHAFDYYDGMNFEIRSQALGPTRPVAVGGRYDGLPARLGGGAARAVGCMVRPWRAYAGGEA